jgi:DNA-binding IclR family transcriptional regulator
LKATDLPPDLRTKADVEALLANVRAKGFATTEGYHKVPGVEAVAAPVFNFKNEITMAVLVVGVQGMFDISAEGEVVTSLKRSAETLSRRLGYSGEPKQP